MYLLVNLAESNRTPWQVGEAPAYDPYTPGDRRKAPEHLKIGISQNKWRIIPTRLEYLYTGFILSSGCAEQINCSSNCLATREVSKKRIRFPSSSSSTLLEYH
jgi:hypothetical protein